MLELLIKASTHAVVFGERITFFPEKTTIDCTFVVEIGVYNAVLLRLSGKVCPNLEDVETERAIYQGTNGGIVYSLCKNFDR